jgi:hypothetical protein
LRAIARKDAQVEALILFDKTEFGPALPVAHKGREGPPILEFRFSI